VPESVGRVDAAVKAGVTGPPTSRSNNLPSLSWSSICGPPGSRA